MSRKAPPGQKRPQNCGTGYCSCIECVMKPAQQEPWCMKMNGCKTKCEDCPVEVLPAQQEPVAFEEWLAKQHGDPEEIGFLQALRIAYIAGQDSITSPAQRTWVGLTDEEVWDLWNSYTEEPFPEWFVDFKRSYKVLEAKLKEKF